MINYLLCLITCTIFFAAPAAWGAESSVAEQMLAETNAARTDPQRYAELLRQLRGQFHGTWFRVPGSLTVAESTEGVKAVDEAIAFLEKQSPLSPLQWSPGLAKAAGALVRDQQERGGVGHVGRRSGGPKERIERYGRWEQSIGENVSYGPISTRQMVMELIIDDGVPGRGHRKNIFSRSYRMAGAACGGHPFYQRMCVMDFAGGFTSGGAKE